MTYRLRNLPETSEVQRDNQGMKYWQGVNGGQLCADANECEWMDGWMNNR